MGSPATAGSAVCLLLQTVSSPSAAQRHVEKLQRRQQTAQRLNPAPALSSGKQTRGETAETPPLQADSLSNSLGSAGKGREVRLSREEKWGRCTCRTARGGTPSQPAARSPAPPSSRTSQATQRRRVDWGPTNWSRGPGLRGRAGVLPATPVSAGLTRTHRARGKRPSSGRAAGACKAGAKRGRVTRALLATGSLPGPSQRTERFVRVPRSPPFPLPNPCDRF